MASFHQEKKSKVHFLRESQPQGPPMIRRAVCPLSGLKAVGMAGRGSGPLSSLSTLEQKLPVPTSKYMGVCILHMAPHLPISEHWLFSCLILPPHLTLYHHGDYFSAR